MMEMIQKIEIINKKRLKMISYFPMKRRIKKKRLKRRRKIEKKRTLIMKNQGKKVQMLKISLNLIEQQKLRYGISLVQLTMLSVPGCLMGYFHQKNNIILIWHEFLVDFII